MLYVAALLLIVACAFVVAMGRMNGPDDDERSQAMKDQIKREGYHV